MTRIPKLPNYGKSHFSIPVGPVPVFHRIIQIMNNSSSNILFPKPIYCTREKALQLAVSKCTFENDLITIQITPLISAEQHLMFLESTELDLTKYTKD